MAVLKDHESCEFGEFVLVRVTKVVFAKRALIAIPEDFILVYKWLDEAKSASSSKAKKPV